VDPAVASETDPVEGIAAWDIVVAEDIVVGAVVGAVVGHTDQPAAWQLVAESYQSTVQALAADLVLQALHPATPKAVLPALYAVLPLAHDIYYRVLFDHQLRLLTHTLYHNLYTEKQSFY
jgi:hypothetical protein